jgi:hypothetical protein
LCAGSGIRCPHTNPLSQQLSSAPSNISYNKPDFIHIEGDMPDTPEFLAERLEIEGNKSVEFFKELPAETHHLAIYTEGTRWSILQIAAHFLASETSLYLLLQDILDGGLGAPEEFNIDSYNESAVNKIQELSLTVLMDQFLQQRYKIATLVKQLSVSDLERQGRHPFLGLTTLGEIIKIIYRHNQIHQREIRKALSSVS